MQQQSSEAGRPQPSLHVNCRVSAFEILMWHNIKYRSQPSASSWDANQNRSLSYHVVLNLMWFQGERMKRGINDKKRGKTEILTSSPYKSELEVYKEERNERKSRPKPKIRRNLMAVVKHKGQEAKKSKLDELVMSSSQEEEQSTKEACIFCGELYSHAKGKEDWSQCSGCHGWAHEICSNAEEDETFVCAFCD